MWFEASRLLVFNFVDAIVAPPRRSRAALGKFIVHGGFYGLDPTPTSTY